METRYQAQQKAASASRAGGGSGNEEATGPYGVATGPRPACERPGELAVRGRPKEDHFGAEGRSGDYGRERDERRGGKGKGKGPLGREESRSTPTPTPTPSPAPRLAPGPRNNKDGPSGDAWEVLSEEECQSAKDSAAGQNINFGVVREEELKTPCSPQAVYPSDGTSSTDGGASRVQNQDALHPMRAGMKGAAPQGSTRENDELREENRQLKEKLKESEKNAKQMFFKCERLRKQIAGDETVPDEESLMDQVDELRTEVWERNDKIKELEKELAYNAERSRALTMIRDHSTNQSRVVMTLKDRIKALEEHLHQRGEMDALSSDSDQESLTALVSTLETANVEMGKQLETVETDKSMLEGAFVKLQQELKDRNKRISDMRHENLGLSSDKGKLKEQIAALNQYLEKAHQQLEQCKQEKEEGKKYLEEIQTKLDITTAQVAVFKEDFEAERNSRAEAVGKTDDVRKEYETKIEEMRKDLTATRATLENTEQLLIMKQQQFHEHLENVDKQHKDYQEKMESDLAAKAAQVKQYYKQTMTFKEQVDKLAKEREEALKDKEQTKRVLEDLRKKREADSQSAAPESRSTGLFAKQKKKKSKTMEMTSPVDTTVLQEVLLRLKDKVEVLSQEKAPVQHVDAEESTTAGMSQQQLMNAQQRRQKKQELGPWPQLIEVDTGTGPEQKQHHHQRGRQNEHERPGSAEWDDSFQQDESNLDFWQPTSLPQAYSEQQQKQSQRGYGGNMGQPHPNTDPCLLDTGGDDFSAYDRRNADAHAHRGSGSALPIEHPPGRPPRPPGGAAARDKGSGVAVSPAEVSRAQSPKRKAGAGSIPTPQKSMEEQLPDPIYPPAAVEYDRDHDRQRGYYDQEGDNLMLDLGSDIQDNAELIRGEVGPYRDRQMTLEHVPFDPNLTCPYCQKMFRKGEIQKFRKHVQLVSCKVSAADGGTIV